MANDISNAPDHAPTARFQVLALDGGGIRGIFTAAMLARLEQDLGRPIVDHFDLVVGTSTGGIVALGLGAGLSPLEILDFYVTEGPRIFRDRLGWRRLRRPFAPKFGSGPLEAALRRIFGERLLGESRVPLVIPSFNLGENAVYLFKTPHHPRLKRDYRDPMWAVAMATSAAPTFFPTFRLPGSGVRLIDGGVWANNPSLVGVTEAVSLFAAELGSVRLLSLGTTSVMKLGRSRLDDAGLIGWARPATDVFLDGQSAGAFAQTQLLLGSDRCRRLDPPAPPELGSLDRCDAVDLIGMAAHYSRQFAPDFETVFGDHERAPYTPLRRANTQEDG